MHVLLAVAMLLAPAWKSDPHRLVLHRAAAMVAPENSAPALEAAVRQGADGVEIDVRRTLDGHLVLYHDDWVLQQHGPGIGIEDLTLAEVQQLDIGERWGVRWKGLRAPLFRDALAFAKANELLLYLDVKDVSTTDFILAEVAEAGCEHLVMAAGPGLRSPSSQYPPIPWIEGWNYLDGGEEDLGVLRQALARQTLPEFTIMADDGRAWSMVLGRNPGARAFIPFVSTSTPAAGAPLAGDLASDDPVLRRAACRRLAAEAAGAPWPELRRLAETDPSGAVRLEAIRALGQDPEPATTDLLLRIFREADSPNPEQDPSGVPYFGTFRRVAVAVALVQRGAWNALEAIAADPAPFAREAVAYALSSQLPPREGARLAAYLASSESDSVVNAALSHAGRFGPELAPALFEAAQRGGYAGRNAVFLLAGAPDSYRQVVRDALLDPSGTTGARRAAALIAYWASSDAAEEIRQDGLTYLADPEVRSILQWPRPWE